MALPGKPFDFAVKLLDHALADVGGQAVIAGNLIAMLRTLVPANDARTHLASVVPSLLVEGLTIAGG